MDQKNKKSVWATVATIAVIVVVGAGARWVTSEGIGAGQRALTSVEDVERALDQEAEGEPFLSALRENFPEDWVQLRGEVAADVKSNLTTAQVRERTMYRARALLAAKGDATAQAPRDALLGLAKAESNFIAQLKRESTQACADFGVRGLQPNTSLSAEATTLLSAGATQRVVATRAGLDQPTTYSEPSERDFTAMVEAMRQAGADQATLDMMFADQTAQATPKQQCDGSTALYTAIGQLPPDQGARLYSFIAREAAKQTALATPQIR